MGVRQILTEDPPRVLWVGPDSIAEAVEKLKASSVDVVVIEDPCPASSI
jgi:hypothetical protein